MRINSEHTFQYGVVRALQMSGFIVWNTDVMDALKFFGHKDAMRFAYIRHHKNMGYTKGQSDLVVAKNGQFWAIELKTPKGKQSKEQKQFQAICEFNGIQYIIIRNYTDLERFIEESRKTPKIGGTN